MKRNVTVEYTIIAVCYLEEMYIVSGKRKTLIHKLKETDVWDPILEELYNIHPDLEIKTIEDLERVLGEWGYTFKAEGLIIKVLDTNLKQEMFLDPKEKQLK